MTLGKGKKRAEPGGHSGAENVVMEHHLQSLELGVLDLRISLKYFTMKGH